MELRNQYWVMRHGRSKPNEAHVIVSSPVNASDARFGLTAAGEAQAEAAGQKLKAELGESFDVNNLRVYISPFTRTVQTASQAAAAFDLSLLDPRLKLAPELRERFFGDLEMQSDDNYKQVWADDANSLESRPPGEGESVVDVASRLEKFVKLLEQEHSGKTMLLVSHGDTLSILWAVVNGLNLFEHRSYALQTGEVKCLRP